MTRNGILCCLFSIPTLFLSNTVAREGIVGGEIVNYSTIYRYQATILIANHEPICGGGIIHRLLILTAARCVIARNGGYIGNPTSALVGTHDLSVAGGVYKAEKIIVAKEYNPRNPRSYGNMAILRLTVALDMETYNLKQLKIGRNTIRNFYDIRQARIVGFGWDQMFQNQIFGTNTDHKLRSLYVNVLGEEQCNRDHPDLNYTLKYLCGKAKDHDCHRGACIGDEGGPLVYEGQTVIGVLSVPTVDCNEKNGSAVYTSVVYYRHLIDYAKGNSLHPTAREIPL